MAIEQLSAPQAYRLAREWLREARRAYGFAVIARLRRERTLQLLHAVEALTWADEWRRSARSVRQKDRSTKDQNRGT